MRKIFIILFINVITFQLIAQNKDTLFTKKYIQKLSFYEPTIAGEYLLNENGSLTINYNIGLKKKYQYISGRYSYNMSNESLYYYFLSFELRNYINVQKRIKADRRVDKFSGPYGGFKIEYGNSVKEYTIPYNYFTFDGESFFVRYFECGPLLGYQQAIGNYLYFDVNAGVGPLLNNNFFYFNFFTGLKFGVSF